MQVLTPGPRLDPGQVAIGNLVSLQSNPGPAQIKACRSASASYNLKWPRVLQFLVPPCGTICNHLTSLVIEKEFRWMPSCNALSFRKPKSIAAGGNLVPTHFHFSFSNQHPKVFLLDL